MLTEITTLLTYTAVLGLALLICYSLIQLNEMAAVIAVMVPGLALLTCRSLVQLNKMAVVIAVLVPGLALLTCHGLVQLHKMAAVVAVMVLGLGTSITCTNVLTHGELATYDSYGVGAVIAVLVLGLGTCITCMNGLTHGEVASYGGYGVGSGAPDLGWGPWKVPDPLRSQRLLPGGAFLGQRAEWCLESYRKAPGRTPRPLAASPGAFPPHPVALAQLLGA